MTTLPPITGAMPGLSDASTDLSAATTYTDVNALAALKRDPNSPEALSAVAQQVEALFLQMMLKSMRDATAAEETDSNEMGMYQDMFDKQVALSISQHADLGIGRLLKRQLAGKSAPSTVKLSSGAASIGAAGTGAASTGAAIATPPSAAAPTAAIAHSPAEFVNRIMPSIQRAASALGVNPLGMLAQAALETGWGQRLPRNADGSSSHNLFGIKAGNEWTGARAAADSMEVIDGVATPRRSMFRAYGSIEESVNDFANLLKNSPRYREVLAAGADPGGYVAGMGKSGYATDPDYGNKLNQILGSDTLQWALGARVAAL
ncbi:MAG TPA: flagellar assembly peptidoglycan hydrolase FlgJ [Steroidobacteraceae bacterium]|jgi:flagellar protein FlgJ|nr:flagellar assembly peptidoglycan hydrolase FlgJ [Steroidobacteraceae bacterium]